MNPDIEKIVGKSRILQLLPLNDRMVLQRFFREEAHAFGSLIVKEGDAADAFFILLSGRARVFKRSVTGDEIPLNVLTPGSEFGEMGLLEGGRRSASVRCSTDVKVLRLDRSKFIDLIEKNPQIHDYVE